jgi:hypothetical protein
MKTLHRSLTALFGAVPFVLASAAHASLYTNQIGPDISYTNINEFDSQLAGPPPVSSTPTGLFGAPTLSPAGSDNLSFPTSTFIVLVADGQYEFQDGKLTMDIAPTSSTGTLDSLSFDEGGAWRVTGENASVEATLLFNDLRITSLDNVPLASPIIVTPTFSQTITVQNGSPATATGTGDVAIGTGDGGDANGIWDITATFDLDAALAAAGKTGDITGVSVALDDQLLGDTGVNEESELNLGQIDKKHIIVSGITTTTMSPGVPEPASLSGLLLGAAALVMRRRKPA